MMGHQMLAIVAAWDLYRITRSPLALGNVGLAQVLPVFLFTFITGQVADRYNRRRTLIITQTSAALVGVVLASAGQGRGVFLIYACMFLISATRAFQWPTTSSMLPQTVPIEQLTSAISWNGSLREMATMAGPALGGLMIQWWGSESVYIGQAICAAISAVCLAQVQVPPIPAENRAAPSVRGFTEGLRFVWRERIIFWSMCLDLLAVLFGGATALMPIFALEVLKVGAGGLGWLQAAPAVGAALMSLVLAHFGTIRSAGRVLLASVIGFGAATVVFAVVDELRAIHAGALPARSLRRHQCCIAHQPGATAHARLFARTRVRRECSVYIQLQSMGRCGIWGRGEPHGHGALGGVRRTDDDLRRDGDRLVRARSAGLGELA